MINPLESGPPGHSHSRKNPTHDIVISEINPNNSEMLLAIGRLRVRVWSSIIPGAAGMEPWVDERDALARHWLVKLNGDIVAAARMSMHGTSQDLPANEGIPDDVSQILPLPIALFNRLVVVESARGLGIGGQLDALRLSEAERLGCQCALLITPSGPRRVRHLESLGFRVVGATGDYREGPFAYRPTFEEAVLMCDLPRGSDYRAS